MLTQSPSIPTLPPSNLNSLTLFCDGASRGNPGPGAYGFVVFSGSEIVARSGACLGTVTNNVAEYQGLVNGLKRCLELGAREITVKSDSELLVRQLNGQYKVKAPQLKVLFDEARTLLQQFKKTSVSHVRREENSLADALANEALDRR
jgi:ribonuclease HI